MIKNNIEIQHDHHHVRLNWFFVWIFMSLSPFVNEYALHVGGWISWLCASRWAYLLMTLWDV